MKKRISYARKYAYFDIKTGKLVFEYGGHSIKPLFLKNNQEDDKEVEGYVIGVLCQEMRFDNHGTFHFYVAGDFWGEKVKKSNIVF